MGLFSNLFKGTKYLLKSSFYLGSIYTFFAYFYVEEVKYRLGDAQQTERINNEMLRAGMQSLGDTDFDQLIIYFGTTVRNILIFYARAWNFKEFTENCSLFHKNVIKTIVKNYEEYGIFKNKKQMEKDLKKNQVNPDILKKLLEVKEVNSQMTASASDLYFSIIKKQISMNTGAIIGLTSEEESKINLIYEYIQKGLFLSSTAQEDYWKYKLMQSDIKKHSYSDVIFKLLYI